MMNVVRQPRDRSLQERDQSFFRESAYCSVTGITAVALTPPEMPHILHDAVSPWR